MAPRIHSSVLALATSAVLFACTAGAPGDGILPLSSEAPDAPGASLHYATPRRPPVSADHAVVAKPGGADGRPTYVASVSTDKTSYAYGEAVSVHFGAMSEAEGSWISLAPKGSSPTEYSWYEFTHGATEGDAAMRPGDYLPPGTYVARAYFGSSFEIMGESGEITVGAMDPAPGTEIAIANGASGSDTSFDGFEKIDILFRLDPQKTYDVGIYPLHASTLMPYAWTTTSTSVDGVATVLLGDLVSGVDYEVRVFDGTEWKLSSSTHFRVQPAVRAKKETFSSSDPVEIDFAGVQGLSPFDEIAIAPAGSLPCVKADSQYAGARWSGTVVFDRPAPGAYVARLFDGVGDSATARAESVHFVVE